MSAQPNAPHLLQWTTAAVESSQRLSYWVDAVCEAFLEMECTAVDAHGFAGQLQSLPKGAISLNRVVASAQDVFRTRHAISRSVDAPFYLITDTCCEWQVRQDGETAHLRAGDAVLIDSAKPYEFHFQQGVSCLSIQIARGCLSQWLDAPEARGLRLTRHDQGWGQSLAALNRQFFGDLPTANALPQDLLVDHIGALLGVSLSEPERGGQAELKDLVGMARHCIGADLASSTLTAVVVAAQLGVSVRTLHRAFAQRGLSFLQCLQSQRIERAAHMLRQARLAHVLVGEIGRRCGFPDASHFVRVFQQHRGITPSHWRRQALP